MAIAAAAAIPFGSNRPAFWALWALLSAVGYVVYGLARTGSPSRFRLSAIRVEQWLFVAVAAAMLVQLVPVGELLPLTLPTIGDVGARAAAISVSPGDTWLAFLRWSTYGLLFLMTLEVSVSPERSRFLSCALALVAAVEAIYALAALTVFGDTILVFEKTAYQGVATGTFVNRNSLATFLGIGCVLSLCELLRDRTTLGAQWQRDSRLLFALALFLNASGLLATQSRMGLAATGLGLATVLLIQRRSLSSAFRFALLPVIAMLALVAYLFGEGLLDRSIYVEAATTLRGDLYRQVVSMIAERPILGFGAGAFKVVFPIFHEASLAPEYIWDLPHSTYLSLWVGLGVVVGSLPIVIVGSFFIRMVRAWRRDGASRIRYPGSAIPGAVGATVVVGVHATVDFGLEIQAVAIAYTITLALGVSEALKSSRDRRAAPRA